MTESPQKPRPRSKIKPPPNYNSRRMQIRLFVFVAACMGVIYLAVEAAQPDNWRRFFGQEIAQPVDVEPEEIDTRLEAPVTDGNSSTVPGAVTIIDPFRGALDEKIRETESDGLARARADGWAALYQSLSFDDRGQIAQALRAAREERPLTPDEAAAWQKLLTRCDEFWDGYRSNAAATLASDDAKLTPDERAAWLKVLDELLKLWKSDRAALAALGSSEGIEEEQAARIEELQQRWDRLALASIKDDTLHRGVENDAWWRLFGILKETTQADLERAPAEEIGFVQMFKQPNDYRGKLVRFRGRIMQAKPLKAPANIAGVKQQYLLWIRPEGGPQSPIVVYALEMPRDFPSLAEPNAEGGYTRLREDVEVTGYFFKRWAYNARDGVNTAPLVLAKAPRWFPSVDVSRGDSLPTAATLLIWVIGSALVGAFVAFFAWQRSRELSPALESFQTSPAAQRELADSLHNADAGPNVEESLRLLAERDRRASKGYTP